MPIAPSDDAIARVTKPSSTGIHLSRAAALGSARTAPMRSGWLAPDVAADTDFSATGAASATVVDAAAKEALNWTGEADFAVIAARDGISVADAADAAIVSAPATAARALEIMIFMWIFKCLCYHADSRFHVRAYFD